jgi:Excalibur calcium-binding domain
VSQPLRLRRVAGSDGIGKLTAREHTSGEPVATFKRNATLYNLAMSYNRGLDRNEDGIACELALLRLSLLAAPGGEVVDDQPFVVEDDIGDEVHVWVPETPARARLVFEGGS